MSDGIYPCDPVSGIAGAGRYCFREDPEQYSPLDHAVGLGCIALIVGAVRYMFTDIVNDKTEEGMQSDLYLADITISDTDLDTYARSKLQTVF